MTLSELIEQLLELQQDAGDDNPEVRLAHQPQWPFEYSLTDVLLVDVNEEERLEIDEFLNVGDPDDEEARAAAHERRAELDAEPGGVVYLGEGSQLGYLPQAASSKLGWR